MKWANSIKLIAVLIVTIITFFAIESCSTTKDSTGGDLGDVSSLQVEKSGATLWGENCSRCHNTPDPSAFSDVQWEAIGTHMRIRGGLTADETEKIVEFLKQSN